MMTNLVCRLDTAAKPRADSDSDVDVDVDVDEDCMSTVKRTQKKGQSVFIQWFLVVSYFCRFGRKREGSMVRPFPTGNTRRWIFNGRAHG